MDTKIPRETILIVEDNPDVRQFLRDAVLDPRRYRTLSESDGQRGLRRAMEENPDLLLLDIGLPHLQGLALLRLLKQQGKYIPTIVLTAYSSEETILEAFRLGVKDFLQKPFSVDEAHAAIEKALAEERLRREKERLTRALFLTNHQLQRQVQNWIALHNIAQAITSTLDESEIYRRVMANVNRILHVEAGSLLLTDHKTGNLKFQMTLHGDTTHFAGIHLKPGQGIAGWVAQHKQALLVPDVEKDARFYPDIDRALGFRTRAVLCVPLKSKGEIIGVLEVVNKLDGTESPSFTRWDLEMLEMLASWVSVAVENARLNRTMREMTASKTIKQVVVTVAHHVNNRLMNISLELDHLEEEREPSLEQVHDTLQAAHQWIEEIAEVIRALDRVGEIHTVPYVGTTEMLDIKALLDHSTMNLKR